MCSPAFEEDGRRVQRCFSGVENPATAFCNRHHDGDRPSIRVSCSHMIAAPVKRNHVRTRGQRMTALRPIQRKKAKSPLSGVVFLLTMGDLISVRPGLWSCKT